ncbi:MAG: metallopeptidase family protein [Oscillospiraceae bacterium]|jgi:predicted Zn-dependent protease with MMP-like domain|nr:metallopeptidase family protein [Oscillospiraceae bacterium]
MTYEEMQEILSECADALPPQIYEDLNGGILLLPDVKVCDDPPGKGLLRCGEYIYDPAGLGRYIIIYYGSILRCFADLPKRELAEQVKKVLFHELTHHLENLAGDRSLELQDEIDLLPYR